MTSTPAKNTVALSQQLAWTARMLHAVEQGRSLSDALPTVPAALRPGVQALTFYALRHWGQATVVLQLLAQRSPPPLVRALLGVGLTLLCTPAIPSVQPDYAPHTVVNQTVAALATLKVPHAQAGFINGCLRRFLRERSELEAKAEHNAIARWNHPFWWVQRVRRDHPQHWQAVLTANNQAAPMTLRVNRRHLKRDAYLAQLQADGHTATPVGDDGVVLARAVPVERLPGWMQGHASVQDAAAQLAAPLLLQGMVLPARARVLDACAAPGGKTAHLLEYANLDVLALDVDPLRCQRIHDNLQRLGLCAEVRAADAAMPAQWWDGHAFDAILLDAPCTASGIVRRHPDVRWLRWPDDIAQLAAQQLRLLEALWPLLKQGGRLLYCTCSVFKAEGEQQIAAFVARHTAEVQVLPAPGHLLPGGINENSAGECDGFFYALLQKSSLA